MDSGSSSPIHENDEPKAEFRKLTNEAVSRKYRRRSPVGGGGSSDEDGSPKRDHGSREYSKVSESERKYDDRGDDKSFSRCSNDSYKHSSRSYHSRHDDYSRHGKYADEDRSYQKSSLRSGRESRGGTHSDYRDREGDYYKSRDHYKDGDKYSRDKSDGDRKYKDRDLGHDGRHGSRYDDRDRRSRGRDDRDDKRDYRSSRDQRNNSILRRETSDLKDLSSSKYSPQGKSGKDGLDKHEAKPSGDKSAFSDDDYAVKRTKFCSEDSDARKDERQASGSKQGEEAASKVTSVQVPVDGSDSATNVDAAKVAAMRAAELVNKNLVGTGFMTADQKKKLLWGNKKSSNLEESSHHWDTSLFNDRERQEKFNKLMSLRLPWYVWPIVGCQGRCEGGDKTSEQPRCREAERTSDGFGEAIHGWAPSKGWPHSWVRLVRFMLVVVSVGINMLTLDLLGMVHLYENCGNLGDVYLPTCCCISPFPLPFYVICYGVLVTDVITINKGLGDIRVAFLGYVQ